MTAAVPGLTLETGLSVCVGLLDQSNPLDFSASFAYQAQNGTNRFVLLFASSDIFDRFIQIFPAAAPSILETQTLSQDNYSPLEKNTSIDSLLAMSDPEFKALVFNLQASNSNFDALVERIEKVIH